jgi:hypothetical protein
MPQLIKKIEGELIDLPIGSVQLITSVTGQVQEEDYINMNGLVAFLQNFSKIEDTEGLLKPINFGLRNTNNITMITLEIDY